MRRKELENIGRRRIEPWVNRAYRLVWRADRPQSSGCRAFNAVALFFRPVSLPRLLLTSSALKVMLRPLRQWLPHLKARLVVVAVAVVNV